MKRSGLILSLALVFVSGLVVGALGYRLYEAEVTAEGNSEKHWDPAEWRRRYTETLQKRLGLTGEQMVRLNDILDQTKSRFEALEKQMDQEWIPKKREIRDQQVTEIEQILTPAQRTEFQKLREEHAAHRRKSHPERGERRPIKKGRKGRGGKP